MIAKLHIFMYLTRLFSDKVNYIPWISLLCLILEQIWTLFKAYHYTHLSFETYMIYLLLKLWFSITLENL